MTLTESVARIRAADAELASRHPRPFPLPIGDLAPVVAGALAALEAGDWWVPSLRERVGAVLRGVSVDRLVDGALGARPYRVAPPTGSPALRALLAVGLALADPARVALVHLGVGSAADGALHEALNLAALTRARVIFLLAVHPLDGDAPLGPQIAFDPAALGRAFGLPTLAVDGTDPAAVQAAVAQARSGPHLIHAALARALKREGRT